MYLKQHIYRAAYACGLAVDDAQQPYRVDAVNQTDMWHYLAYLVGLQVADEVPAHIFGHGGSLDGEFLRAAFTEIALAGKQAVAKIKAEIASLIIAKSTGDGVKAAVMDAGFIKEMLLAAARNWNGADASKVELQALLPEAERERFDRAFADAAGELLAAGIEVGYSDRVSGGFRVGARDGGYYVSFSDADFDALLREYLREKVFRMLFEA